MAAVCALFRGATEAPFCGAAEIDRPWTGISRFRLHHAAQCARERRFTFPYMQPAPEASGPSRHRSETANRPASTT
jgi:hypothetical protein